MHKTTYLSHEILSNHSQGQMDIVLNCSFLSTFVQPDPGFNGERESPLQLCQDQVKCTLPL